MRHCVLAIVVSTLIALPVRGQPTAEEIIRYPHREAELVYRAVFDDVFRSDGSPRTILVYDSLGHSFARIDLLISGVSGYPAGFDVSALRNFLRVTSTRLHPHGRTAEFALAPFPRFTYPIPVRRIAPEVFRTLRGARQADTILVMRNGSDPILIEEAPFWTAFRKNFPAVWGWTVLTRVGFNEELTHAFVQIMHRCYSDCTSVESVFLRKSDDRWSVTKRVLHPEASREGFPPGQLRYVGKGGWMRGANARFETDRKREIADSLRRSKAPRSIRGRLVNARTGRGMAGHPVYQLLGRDDNPDSVAVTDKRGWFRIANPAIGGWFLSVQCDKKFGHYRSLADAGFYLGPGVDTTIVFEARSLAPCWDRRIHPLQSGEVESGVHRTSNFPDSIEAAVYDAVFDFMFPGTARPLLRSHTAGRCSFEDLHCDGTSHLALLLRERSADSATVHDYNRARGEHVPLNSAFARKNSMDLLTPSMARYLIAEAIAATPEQDQHLDEESFWYAIERAYPQARGILAVTRIGFDSSRREALVTVRHETDLLSSAHRTFLLRQRGASWRVVRDDLEHERIGAEVIDGSCLVARVHPVPHSTHLAGNYDFTFVSTDGRVDTVRLNSSRQLRWKGDHWDLSLGRRLLRIGTNDGARVSGIWMAIGTDVIPIDSNGNRLPERNGHFCAVAVKE